MKSMNDIRCLPKRLEDRAEAPLLPPQPYNVLDGKAKPSSWQRSVKRKFPSSACEPPLQARKPESTLRSSRSLRPQRQLACIRKSLSDPLQVFGDGDGSENQHSSLSGTTPSDLKDGLSKHLQGQHGMMDLENLSKEKRRSLRPGLKDSTNVDPKAAVKQNSLQIFNEVVALKEALCVEKEARRCLQAELDEERNAASSAANEAMAMIARLQEEKAAVLMEARQFKRMSEERELHNQEAISLLKEMLLSKEEEALALENELATCRQVFLAIEGGEPTEHCGLKYLDTGSYHGRTIESELGSTYSEEGLTSWTRSYCVKDLSRKACEEEPINSEFNGRRYFRCFNDLISDNVRSNLESYFIQAGEPFQELQNHGNVDVKTEISKAMFNITAESTRSVDMLDRSFKGSKAMIPSESILSNDDTQPSSRVGLNPLILENRLDPAVHLSDEQTRSLWERIMKLEHRLETFGAEGQDFEFALQENVAPASQTPGFRTSELQVKISPSDVMSHDEHCSQGTNAKGDESVERPAKLQCREGLSGFQQNHFQVGVGTWSMQTLDSVSNSQQDHFQVSMGDLGGNCSTSVEEHGEMVKETVEGVLDIYEVGHFSNQSSQNDGCSSPVDDNSLKSQTDAHENSDLAPELTAPDLEAMDVESHSSMFSPPDVSDARNMCSTLSAAEKQELNMRLQVLEREKHAMHQAILSLQTENKELKLLHDLASKLRDVKHSQNLKRNVQSSEQPSKRAKSEQSSFTSFLRGFFSYFPSGSSAANLHERSSGVSLQEHGPDSMQKDHVGLSHLLENSPHLKTDTLIVRGLKVKVPAAV